jgi:hypothetical protein
MAIKGTDWQGNTAVARRLVHFAGAYARVGGFGDSTISSSWSSTDAINTSLHYGIINTWRPPRITGWGCLSLSQGDAYGWYSFYGTGVNYDPLPGNPGNVLPDSLALNLIPLPCAYTEFGSNLSNGDLVSRQFIEATTVSPRFAADVGWEQRNVAMTARVVYLRHTAGADMTALGVRPDPDNVEDTKQLNMAGATSIEFLDLALSNTSTDTNPGAQLTARTGVNETGTNLIHLATRIFANTLDGFEFTPCGIGGTTVAQHAGTTIYTDEALRQWIAAMQFNTFLFCFGANGGLGGSKATFKTNYNAVVDRYRAQAIAAGEAEPLFIVTAPWYNAQVSDADVDLMNEALFELALERLDTLALNLAIQLGDTTSLRMDPIHMKRAGSDAAAQALWDLIEAAAAYVADGTGTGAKRLLKMGVI